MMGESVKVSVLTDKLGQDTTDFYFPMGWWCDVFNMKTNPCFKSPGGPKGVPTPTDMGGFKSLPSTPSDLHVHLREGSVLPMHDLAKIDSMKITSIDALNKNLMTDFYANPSIAEKDETDRTYWSVSLDSLYNDDGISLAPTGASSLKVQIGSGLDNNPNPHRILFDFQTQSASPNSANAAPATCTASNLSDYLGEIRIFRATEAGLTFTQFVTAYVFTDGTQSYFHDNFKHDEATDSMVLSPIQVNDANICIPQLARIYAIEPIAAAMELFQADMAAEFGTDKFLE